MTATGDLLHHFLFERLPVRGHLVRLDASWRAAIEHHAYPEAIASALGEAMAASALMAGALKFEGRLSLQFEGPGPVRLMLAQCTHRHAIRDWRTRRLRLIGVRRRRERERREYCEERKATSPAHRSNYEPLPLSRDGELGAASRTRLERAAAGALSRSAIMCS